MTPAAGGMKLADVLKLLAAKGKPDTKRMWAKHGAKEPFHGVRIADVKAVLKAAGRDHALALELYATGNADAQYLAALMADAQAMTKQDLLRFAKTANWYMVREYPVAGLAADGPHGWSLGLKWIDSKDADLQACGWATLAACLSTRADEEIDQERAKALLARVEEEIHDAANRVRYTMNGYVIAAGCWVRALRPRALQAAKAIGKVDVDFGGTHCSVPDAAAYIAKLAARPPKKRKSARC